MPWVFRCFFAFSAFAPSLRRAYFHRLDIDFLLCHVFCVCLCQRSTLPFPEEVCRRPPAHARDHFNLFLRSVASEGFGLVPSILRFGILCIQTTGLVCVESLCHVFTVLRTFRLSIVTGSLLLSSPIGFVLQIIENVRSIICQWVHAMGVILCFFSALYGLSRVRSVAHWHGFPSWVR